MINEPKHGAETRQKIKVNHGNTDYYKRKKYCARHGWVDLFMIGGDLEWHRLHSKCIEEIEAGAFIETAEPSKVMRKAA